MRSDTGWWRLAFAALLPLLLTASMARAAGGTGTAAIGTENISLSGFGGAFDSQIFRVAKPVTAGRGSLAAADDVNYAISTSIDKKNLTLAAATVSSKTYDGNTKATAAPATAAPVNADAMQAFAELQRRVNDGQFESAYKLGKTLSAMQGDPHFDFLFGIAAINVGRAPEGVFALERHLAAIPGNDRARLDLARGYFDLGDYIRARQEFEFVLRYNPPKDVRANIERYLDAMQTRDALSNKMSSRGYLEVGFGRDSNVNAGTYNTQINLPTGPVVLADGPSKGAASRFMSVTGGGQWVRRVSPPFAVFAGGDFDFKSNPRASTFDTANVSAHVGFSMVSGSLLYRLTFSDSMMEVDSVRYRDVVTTSGEVQYGVGNGLMLNGVVQYSEQSHTGQNSVRDSKSIAYSGGFQKAFEGDWRPAIGIQVSVAQDDNLNRRFDLNRDIFTSRAFAGLSPTEKLGLSVGLAEQRSEFKGTDIAFGTMRRDRLWSVDLGANYVLSRNWVLRAEVQWSENESNQNLYSFRRAYSVLKTRYLF
jgi:hypothetical protein